MTSWERLCLDRAVMLAHELQLQVIRHQESFDSGCVEWDWLEAVCNTLYDIQYLIQPGVPVSERPEICSMSEYRKMFSEALEVKREEEAL